MSNQNPYGQPFNNQPYPPPPPPAQPPAPLGPPPPPRPLSQSDERLWAVLAFLLGILVGILAPLIIYFVYRDRSPFVRAASREALNLQITALIVGLALAFLVFPATIVFSVAVPPLGFTLFVGWFIAMIGYAIAVLCFEIIGAIRANAGVVYNVPFILRFVKD